MICPICQREFKENKRTKYCPICRADKQLCVRHRDSLKRPKRFCLVCGNEIKDKGTNYCIDCRTPEKKKERVLQRQRTKKGSCGRCGTPIIGQAQYCKDCRKTVKKGRMCNREDGTIQTLTLDITLFFQIVRGFSIKEAAGKQQLKPSMLQQYMDEMAGTEQYKKLAAHYDAVKRKRERRKAA
jgi:predicted amidophosphoribosyltransferase